MGRIVSLGAESNFVIGLTTQLIKRRPATAGSTQKSADMAQARYDGWRSGVIEALADYANECRVQHYRKALVAVMAEIESDLRYIPAVETNDARKWVTEIIESWNSGDWKDKADAEWYNHVVTSFTDLTLDESVEREIESHRRKGVREGKIEPTPADAEWIKEELDTIQSVASPLKTALNKIKKGS